MTNAFDRIRSTRRKSEELQAEARGLAMTVLNDNVNALQSVCHEVVDRLSADAAEAATHTAVALIRHTAYDQLLASSTCAALEGLHSDSTPFRTLQWRLKALFEMGGAAGAAGSQIYHDILNALDHVLEHEEPAAEAACEALLAFRRVLLSTTVEEAALNLSKAARECGVVIGLTASY